MLSVARFRIILNRARGNAPELEKMKLKFPNGKLPPFSILNIANNPAILNMDLFLTRKRSDSQNEKFPKAVYRRQSMKMVRPVFESNQE